MTLEEVLADIKKGLDSATAFLNGAEAVLPASVRPLVAVVDAVDALVDALAATFPSEFTASSTPSPTPKPSPAPAPAPAAPVVQPGMTFTPSAK